MHESHEHLLLAEGGVGSSVENCTDTYFCIDYCSLEQVE